MLANLLVVVVGSAVEDTTWKGILDRLLVATGSNNETALASRLGISKQSIYNAKSKKQIPPSWIFEISKTFSVSADWLFFGLGSMHPDEPVTEPQKPTEQPVIPTKTAEHCPQCAELKAELEEERRKRRELSAENRKLWKENGDLRERCATFEERQKICCPEELHQTTQATPFNNAQLRA